MILIIKHISIEGPGLVGDFFKAKGYDLKTIELDKGGVLPEDLKGIAAVVVLGGPMNVYEEEKFPFLKDEDVFIRKVLEVGLPFLGICLGAQLLAKAAGARVKKASREEIGFYRVKLTTEGMGDTLFRGLDGVLDVLQWHEDTFEIPEGGRLLAVSDLCRNQAFRINEKAYGLQFHLETTGEMVKDWIAEYLGSADETLQRKGRQMLVRYGEVKDEMEKTSEKVCYNLENML